MLVHGPAFSMSKFCENLSLQNDLHPACRVHKLQLRRYTILVLSPKCNYKTVNKVNFVVNNNKSLFGFITKAFANTTKSLLLKQHDSGQ